MCWRVYLSLSNWKDLLYQTLSISSWCEDPRTTYATEPFFQTLPFGMDRTAQNHTGLATLICKGQVRRKWSPSILLPPHFYYVGEALPNFLQQKLGVSECAQQCTRALQYHTNMKNNLHTLIRPTCAYHWSPQQWWQHWFLYHHVMMLQCTNFIYTFSGSYLAILWNKNNARWNVTLI